jgi:hypothetical protein
VSFLSDKFQKPESPSEHTFEDNLLMNYLIGLLGTVFATPEEEVVK